MAEFDDAELEELYNWVDSIPLSRPKKNIARDFSDGGEKQINFLKWIPSIYLRLMFKGFLFILQSEEIN